MLPVKVNRVAAFELNGEFFHSMDDAEEAVRSAVIEEILKEEFPTDDRISPEGASACVARRWKEIKQRCDKAFAGI